MFIKLLIGVILSIIFLFVLESQFEITFSGFEIGMTIMAFTIVNLLINNFLEESPLTFNLYYPPGEGPSLEELMEEFDLDE